MKKTFIIKKYETKSDVDALKLQEMLTKINYESVVLGSAVVAQCRETIKLKKVEAKVINSIFTPSDYDIEALNKKILTSPIIKPKSKPKKSKK